MFSVVIPAHNEASVIGRCLSVLLDGAYPNEVELIVVCNGCSDDTEAKARSFEPAVTVLSLPEASKTAALNLGDSAASSFPRFYVDADVELPIEAVRRVAATLESGSVLAASPSLHVDTEQSSAAVRSYYRLWTQLPSVRDDVVGRGVYAVSENGRRRFGAFPEVVADDHFFRSTFARSERTTVTGCCAVVHAPRTLSSLVQRKTRVFAGNREVDTLGGQGGLSILGRLGGLIDALRADPTWCRDLPVFAYVALAGRARTLARRDGSPSWGRDDTRELP